MATTVQQLVDRAIDRSVANRGTSLLSSTPVVLARVQQYTSAIFQRLATMQRTYFQIDEVLTSTASVAASARVVDLADLELPCLRLLKVTRVEDGEECNAVDVRNIDAEYAPRFYVSGTQLVEVYPDWDAGDPGSVDLRVYFLRGPDVLDLDGALTQTVSDLLPDDFTDLLDNRLGRYLSEKDFGRDPKEIAALDADYEARFASFVDYLDNLAGALSVGVAVPVAGSKP